MVEHQLEGYFVFWW